ncbi:MAG: SDR family NAD(P)-dependent oxidoreductase [Sideroxydans sp.]|nr:SDR family NAD(P)-dependent oxidoreductase [Sideroxydans sp.]
MRKIVIVGATSAIAEHCARLWLKNEPADLILLGRDAQRIERVAADLKVRSPASTIHILQADFMDPTAIQTTVEIIANQGPVDIALIAHGTLPAQAECQVDLGLCRDTLEINGISPVLFAECFAKHMEASNRGTIAIIGSVAGDRGRKSNYVYGAAKGLVDRYAQGLQHRLAGSAVKVSLIKPGPTQTPMTAHLRSLNVKLAPVDNVAELIVRGIEAGQDVIYAPKKWRLIMLVIKHMPSSIFNKLNI